MKLDATLRAEVKRRMRAVCTGFHTVKLSFTDAVSVCVEMVKEEREQTAIMRDLQNKAVVGWDAAKQRAEAAEARVQNEIAARRLAQEHGIGDRARIEKLEEALNKWGHVAVCMCKSDRRDPRCREVSRG